MASPQCPQCGQPLADPSLTCASCGYDGAKAAVRRSNRLLTLLLFFAMAVCIVGAGLVFFKGDGASARTQVIIGDLLFIGGFVIYIIARVIIILRQRRVSR